MTHFDLLAQPYCYTLHVSIILGELFAAHSLARASLLLRFFIVAVAVVYSFSFQTVNQPISQLANLSFRFELL